MDDEYPGTQDARLAKHRREFLSTWIAVSLVCVVIVGGWILYSHFEARAYERVTGKRISTWDAMWLDLRVQEQLK